MEVIVQAVVVAAWLVYVAVAFVLRTWLQIRGTGSSGLAGVRRDASAVERVAGVALVGAFGVALVGPFIGRPWLVGPVWPAVGLGLVVSGTIATLGAQLAMKSSWRVGVDPTARTELVTDGPYRVVRNPIFTAMIFVGLGLALMYPTPAASIAPVLLIVGLELQVRLVEEPYLRRVHGEKYLDWARKTGRFVPGLGGLQ
jgi:protein-S-isoprenylcysteine O-methyltransferase Ste14